MDGSFFIKIFKINLSVTGGSASLGHAVVRIDALRMTHQSVEDTVLGNDLLVFLHFPAQSDRIGIIGVELAGKYLIQSQQQDDHCNQDSQYQYYFQKCYHIPQ